MLIVASSVLVIVFLYEIYSDHLIRVYACYGLAFLNGTTYAINNKHLLCSQIIHYQGLPFHALPKEYPLLPLLVFLLPLIAPLSWYEPVFITFFIGVYTFICFFLYRTKSDRHALFFILLTILGGFGTVFARFDLLVGMSILLAVYFLPKRPSAAYFFLAIGTLLKFIPILFIIPFFLYRRKSSEHILNRRTSINICIFLATLVPFIGVSLYLNTVGTLSPVLFLKDRPIEIESLQAIPLWMLSLLGNVHSCYVQSFGSVNIIPVFGKLCLQVLYSGKWISIIITSVYTIILLILLVIFCILYLYRKIKFSTLIVSILIATVCMSKVFSVQYILWIIPLIAYYYGNHKTTLLLWGVFVFSLRLYILCFGEGGLLLITSSSFSSL